MTRIQNVSQTKIISFLPKINREAFLSGDEKEIVKLGNIYSKINNLPLISHNHMQEYLAIRPSYLGEQSKSEWGMPLEDARRCLYDIPRTQKLIQGIVESMKDLQKKTKQSLHAVEAGGGTGILAIAAALAGAQVTLLEINPETQKDTKKFIHFLGLSNKIDVKLADATTYIPNKKFDMIICECLHTGLALEPQLQILHNLGKFLKPHGKLIPEGVHLRWALADVNWNNIEVDHIEKSYLEGKIHSVGTWSKSPYVNFKEEISDSLLDVIKFFIPMHNVAANTILIEMDIVIYSSKHSSITLHGGEGKFVGTPHAIKLKKSVSKKDGSYAFGYYPPGKLFPDKIFPLSHMSFQKFSNNTEVFYDKIFQRKSNNSLELL